MDKHVCGEECRAHRAKELADAYEEQERVFWKGHPNETLIDESELASLKSDAEKWRGLQKKKVNGISFLGFWNSLGPESQVAIGKWKADYFKREEYREKAGRLDEIEQRAKEHLAQICFANFKQSKFKMHYQMEAKLVSKIVGLPLEKWMEE